MKVKCVKASSKTIAGVIYEASSFWNSTNANKWHKGKIVIEGHGRHNIWNFTDENGNSLPQINYINPNRPPSFVDNSSTIEPNDIVICKSDRYKYLICDQKYRIVDVKHYSHGQTMRGKFTNIKLEGYNRWIRYNQFSFRVLTKKESREIAISSILDKPENFSVDFIRKFEKINKGKALMECLSKSILDKQRHHYSILEWAVEKTSKNLGIKTEDFDQILDKPLSEILKLIENNE